MNYLCHARDFLGDPWALAGSVLPIFARVLAPRARLRAALLPPAPPAPGTPAAALRCGLDRHFAENAWFHAQPRFADTCAGVARELREAARGADGRLRAHFAAHVLVEVLLDAWYAEVRPESAPAFRAALIALEPAALERETAVAAGRPVDGLAAFLVRFRAQDYLAGYADDAEVLRRIDALGKRAGLPPLPEGLLPVVTRTRPRVRALGPALLPPSPTP